MTSCTLRKKHKVQGPEHYGKGTEQSLEKLAHYVEGKN